MHVTTQPFKSIRLQYPGNPAECNGVSLIFGVDCLSFQSPVPLQVQSVEKLECAPQNFSRATRAPSSSSIIHVGHPPPPPFLAEILHPPLFCNINQRRNRSFLTSSSIAITSLTIRSSGVLKTGRVFLMSS